ncbi:response regulator [Roseococcus sp. YIM B11640]|uniref:response regulator n=1 Tax=Roseococcus sp. YIM B11640 TaxID=3133973 RepID=UPI003C7AC2A3
MAPEAVKFLLVDDLEANLFALEELLQREGLQIFKAKSGPEALELLLVHDFALALLDVQMEGMDGFELAELMRGTERTRATPIIFLTAVAHDERRHFRGYEAGAVDFLAKPISPQMLLSKTSVFFELARQRQELARQRDDLRDGAEKLSGALARLQAHADNSPLAVIELGPDFRIAEWSQGAERMLGWCRKDVLGRLIEEMPLIDAADRDTFAQMRAELAKGEPRAICAARLHRKDGSIIDCECYSSALTGRAGKVVSVSMQLLDVTERRRAEATQQLLIGELNHRVKNMLGTVQAIAAHTLHGAQDPAAFVTRFNGRLQALAQAHSVLSGRTWTGAMLRELIEAQLQLGTLDPARLRLAGPDLSLEPQQALILGLILHELTTNAHKYGALSTPQGQLELNWRRDGGTLRLRWRETGGPAVSAPSRNGFGTTLIEQSMRSEGGEAQATYAPDGMIWDISLPLPLLDGEQAPESASPPAPAAREAGRELAGMRILIVEDEPIIAMQMALVLEQAGAIIQGQAGSVRQALSLIEAGSPDAALLDGNLRGEEVSDVASALTERGVPFVFVSGYGRESLPRAFGSVPLLNKPFSTADLVAAAQRLLPALN